MFSPRRSHLNPETSVSAVSVLSEAFESQVGVKENTQFATQLPVVQQDASSCLQVLQLRGHQICACKSVYFINKFSFQLCCGTLDHR